ncbi:MAG: aldo/keto reductase [Lachnospiraceae bacterium]|nr:aldo/keto reductase [Lachnospiraceae bacterium]
MVLVIPALLAGCSGNSGSTSSGPAAADTAATSASAAQQENTAAQTEITSAQEAETAATEATADASNAASATSEADTGNAASATSEADASAGGGTSPAEGYPQFDLSNGTVTLNDGNTMPILGLGMFSLSDSEAENSTYWALKAGFRLIDTARIYGNEAAVGRGLQRAIDEGIVTREEVFITTKMWTSDFGNGDAAVDASLEQLGVDYIDLMILHHSQPENDVDAYQAMERAVADGKLRSIGLSNYYEPEDFDRLVNATSITPALLQNETHPYHQSVMMKDHIAQYGTVMESWFPLGGRGNTQTLFNDPVIAGIAEAHGVSSPQVIIRWHLQASNICIPGSSNEQHIIEDYDVWDFELTEEEMAQLTALDKNDRFADY